MRIADALQWVEYRSWRKQGGGEGATGSILQRRSCRQEGLREAARPNSTWDGPEYLNQRDYFNHRHYLSKATQRGGTYVSKLPCKDGQGAACSAGTSPRDPRTGLPLLADFEVGKLVAEILYGSPSPEVLRAG